MRGYEERGAKRVHASAFISLRRDRKDAEEENKKFKMENIKLKTISLVPKPPHTLVPKPLLGNVGRIKRRKFKMKFLYFLSGLSEILGGLCVKFWEKQIGGSMPNKIKGLSQYDERWKNASCGLRVAGCGLRVAGCGNETIGEVGCLLTCYCMLAQYLTGIEWNPLQLNYLLKRFGGYMDCNKIVHSTISYLFGEFLFGGLILCKDVPAPISDITLMLPTIVKIDYMAGHWVLVTEQKGDDYVILDPLQTFPSRGLGTRNGGGLGTSESGEEMLLEKYGKPGWGLERIVLTAVVRS